MKLRLFSRLLLFLLAINLLVGYCLYSKDGAAKEQSEAFSQIDLLMEVLQVVRGEYIHHDAVVPKKVFHSAINGVLSSLDPYCALMEGDDVRLDDEEQSGTFGGIGIGMTLSKKYLVVQKVFPHTPADVGGLKAGDVILEIDGVALDPKDLEKDSSRLRGPVQTKVEVTYRREGVEGLQKTTLTRAVIPNPSVVDTEILEGNIGYFRILEFTEQTPREVESILSGQFTEKKVAGVIIDVRGNPGGLLMAATDICSFFVPAKKFLVSVEGRNAEMVIRSRMDYKFPNLPLVILVDGNSASGSEVFAGAMRVHNRGKLVGTKTFGKGIVQDTFVLSHGQHLRLTTGQYFLQPPETENRLVIHGKGLEPDVTVIDDKADAKIKAFDKRMKELNSQLDNGDITPLTFISQAKAMEDELQKQDVVIRKALDIITAAPAEAQLQNKQDKGN